MYEAWTVDWNMPILVDDRFRRTVNGEWGTAPGGAEYTTVGTATDFWVDGSEGVIGVSAVNSERHATVDIGTSETHTARVYNLLSVTPAGAAINWGILLRYSDVSNYYWIDAQVGTDSSITLRLIKRVGGSITQMTTAVAPITHSTTIARVLEAQYSPADGTLQARVWSADAEAVPEDWHISWTDTAVPAGTRVGVIGRLTAGNSNSLPVTLRFDDFRATVAERWVDVTSYVDTSTGPFEITDGDTPESSVDTGGFGLPLVNADQRFTPGNVHSPYYPNVAPGSEIRVRETIGDTVFDRGHGYVQYPEILAWTESNEDTPRDQTIIIPVVDRAAWIAQGRTFISTLAEHIIHNGGPALVAYWPLGETQGPDMHPAVGAPWTLTQTRRVTTSGNAPAVDPASIAYGSTGIAPADDLSSVLFEPAISADPFTEFDNSLILAGKRSTSLTLDVDQVLTIVGWLRPASINPIVAAIPIALTSSTDSQVVAEIKLLDNLIFADGGPDAWLSTVDGAPIPVDQAIPVAFRLGFDPEVVELWIRSEVYTGSIMFFEPATPLVLDQMEIGVTYPGAVNHVQVYLGGPDDWTHEHFLAQAQMGLTGLERQTTGERIRTILQYAEVDPSELGRIDDGSSLMQVARLAGRNPMDLVAEAVATEQGEFWIAGDNRPVFAGRVRLYNI